MPDEALLIKSHLQHQEALLCNAGFKEQWQMVGVAAGIFSSFIGRPGLFTGVIKEPEEGETAECTTRRIKSFFIKHSSTEEYLVNVLPSVLVGVAANFIIAAPTVEKKCLRLNLDPVSIEC